MASALREEIESNFATFEAQWPAEFADAQAQLLPSRQHFVDSYVRISSIQAWRTTVLMGTLDEDSEAFFFEGQNDFLISHCLARCGSFRQALKALRSAIENIYFCLYYKDHAVELKKWMLGKHKLGFTELHSYFESHPTVTEHTASPNGLEHIKAEYSTLSKAVHGSAKSFRMTKNLTEIRLWGGEVPEVSQWATREKAVIVNVNLLLLHIFRDQLLGAKNRNLRESIGLVVPKSRHIAIKAELGVTLVAS